MADGTGYFANKYWHPNYWHANYWAPTGSAAGDYWNPNYWASGYWHANYWAKAGDIGEVQVQNIGTRTSVGLVAEVRYGLNALPDTETRTLTTFDPLVQNNVAPTATLGTRTLTAFNPTTSTQGYIAADIDVQWYPEATITLTYGVNVSLPTRTTGTFHPTTSTESGLSVGASLAGKELESFPANVQNNVEVQPVPATRTLTPLRPAAAGQGLLVPATLGVKTVTGIAAAIIGTERDIVVRPNVGVKTAIPLVVTVFGRNALVIPPPTFPPDDSITNANADTYPSNYEICDRTGFRLPAGELVGEWTGVKVREESWERRNAQDFVRGVADDLEGSPRPEQTDRFTADEYPGGVTPDDL